MQLYPVCTEEESQVTDPKATDPPVWFVHYLTGLSKIRKMQLLEWMETEGASNVEVVMFNSMDEGEWTMLRQGG